MIWWVGGSLGRVRCGRWEEGVKKNLAFCRAVLVFCRGRDGIERRQGRKWQMAEMKTELEP